MERERERGGGEKIDIKWQHKYLKHLVLARNTCLMVQVVARCAIEATCVVHVCIVDWKIFTASICKIFLTVDGYSMDEHLESS